MESPEQLKEKQKRHWDDVADGWATWLQWTEQNFTPVTRWMADAVHWQEAARALDIGCGAGYPSLAAARAVGPRGVVTATDLSPRMLEAARKAAASAGLENLSFREMDAEQLHFAADSFDAATNTYGLMFCPDPARALAEARRVLAPGGRFAAVVWDHPAKSPYFSIITGVAVRQFGFQPPQPGGPGPFRFASSDELTRLMESAGFSRVRVESCASTFVCASADEYCQMFGDLAWKTRMSALSTEAREHFVKQLDDAVSPYRSGGVLRLVATSLCACGQKEDGLP